MENSFRIHTEITKDAVLNVNMRQDFDFLEVLSLKLRQADAYKLHSSNYGVIVGRVLANDAFGIPNARVSVFIPNEGGETSEIEKMYPYSSIRSTDSDGRRYNLLPDYSENDCYRVVGTMPSKRLVLDNNTVLEVFDKYWKYSTVTNNAGDYMIFGVPSGNQELKIDLDLSDIGILSQKPTDFTYKGYNLSMFDSPTQFKESTNLDSLPQLFSQNKSVFVYPFWGDVENGIAAITRSDIQIQYKFEPTCVFMGSIISDNDSNAINHKCAPDINNGMNDQLVTGEGNIEMIRKTPDGLVEEFQVQTGESLIDSNGVWCYQIPMNLDYVGTDEYGNIVPTDNPSKGVPTRAQVRFRISKNETGDEGFSRHTAKYLVPMNPIFDETETVPTINVPGKEIEKMYNFGSNTPQSCFRDLYWNNVYSVKNYIPKVQVAHRAVSKNYSALKGANLATDQNQVPFNKLRVDLPFVYMVLCIVYSMIIVIVGIVNAIICGINSVLKLIRNIVGVRFLGIRPFGFLLKLVPDYIGCIPLSAGLSDDNTAYYPGCTCDSTGLRKAKCPGDLDKCNKSKSGSELKDKIQQSLANEFKIVKLDFYQDWVNGVLYMPLWYWRKRKKKTFLFGLFTKKARNQFCSCDSIYKRLKIYVTCNIVHRDDTFRVEDSSVTEKENKWHKNIAGLVGFRHGLIKQVENKDGLNVYYYTAIQAADETNPNVVMAERNSSFNAVRLYATDIILLGNLNENNMYGIPQFFKALPSTTANIPPIATISEPASDEEETTPKKTTNDNDAAVYEDSGVTLTTGMDWGNKNDARDDAPKYSRGLFMDLACTYANTKAKSCINVERLSELGVNYDTNHDISYRGDGNVLMGPVLADGFITKYELDDLENRAMFATLNHVGFVPQAYQDEIESYDTQVHETNTNYLIPKFHYLYPVDFDGRMQLIMNRYKGGFVYAQTDHKDDSYIRFRMGTIDGNNKKQRKNHFYIAKNRAYSMPLYNNSYYFYFGLVKGNTAIDKFNKKFFSECFQNTKDWFSLDVEGQGKSYCVDAYKPEYKDCNDFDNDKAHGKIKIMSDDIQIPWSYTIKDESGDIVSSSGSINTEYVEVCDNGIDNGNYTVTVTDGNGRTIKRNITLERERVFVNYKTTPLGTKYYNREASTKEYICDGDDGDLYGKIVFTGFTIDGYECAISDISEVSYENEKYEFSFTGTSEVHDSTVIEVSMKVVSSFNSGTTRECMCDGQSGDSKVPEYETSTNALTFYVYEPSTYFIEAVQVCGGVETNNTTTSIAVIENGRNFNAYLNEMPLKFMLGTTEDDANMSVANGSNFYSNDLVINPTSRGLNGWFGVHDENTYRYNLSRNKAIEENERVWADFLDINGEFSSIDNKLNIIRLKFDEMFSVANTTYVTQSSNPTYRLRYEGGTNPLLPRIVAPYYEDTNKLLGGYYLYEDKDSITMDSAFPNIVGSNYVGASSTEFNPSMGNRKNKFGNYFAVFTKNAGYVNNKTFGDTKGVRRIPTHAAIQAHDDYRNHPGQTEIVQNEIKKIGTKIEDVIERFTRVYSSGTEKELIGGMLKDKATKPHFRAMSLDRRFDYNFVVFAPIVSRYISLTPDACWKCGRISGTTYNGIEMAYDEDYNIISANSETITDAETGELEITAVTPNDALEYSYSTPTSEGDSVTVYNHNSRVLKKPYKATINDIIQMEDKFWSQNNTVENVIGNEWDISEINWLSLGTPEYYPSHNGEGNGWFNIGNYPTKRVLDVANIRPMISYTFDYISCSYNGIVERNDNDEIKFIIEPGETEGFTLDFVTPVEFIGANDDNKTYGNLTYSAKRGSDGVVTFVSSKINLDFKMKQFSANDDFDVYTSVPRVLWVLNESGDGRVENRIKTIKQMTGGPDVIDNFIEANDVSAYISEKQMDRPDGVSLTRSNPPGSTQTATQFGFLTSDGEFLTSDDPSYYNTIYKKRKVDMPSSVKVCCLIWKRFYINNSGDNLTKQITTYEFSDMYDVRSVKIAAINGDGSGQNISGSYVTNRASETIVSGDGETSSAGTVHVDSNGTTNIYQQTIMLRIFPDEGYNQALNDAESFGFTMDIGPGYAFTFGSTNDIDANVVERNDDSGKVDHIDLTIRWPYGIGYLGAGTWDDGAYCTLYCKSPSSFVYKFYIKLTGSTPNVTELGDGESAKTTLQINV